VVPQLAALLLAVLAAAVLLKQVVPQLAALLLAVLAAAVLLKQAALPSNVNAKALA